MGLIPNRDRFFTAWAELATGRPRLVLALSLVLALVSLWITVTSLEFKSDRSDLIDPSLPWQQRYADFKDRFPRWDDAIVVVDTESASSEAIERFWRALRLSLAESELFTPDSLIDGFDQSEAPVTLALLEPSDRLREIIAELDRVRPALGAASLGDLLDLIATSGERLGAESRSESIALLERIRAAVLGASGGLDQQQWILVDADARTPITTPSGRYQLGFVSLARGETLQDTAASVNAVAPAIQALRSAVAAARDAAGQSAIEVGVTGTPVLESDETEQSMSDAMIASIISLVAIALMMIVVYRGVTTPLLALAALMLGIGWSFGWVTLAVGHLQVLSVVFAIVLLGLGVDNAIHLIARLELVHPDHEHMPMAVAQAMRGVGAGVVTGALTTAAAFGAMAFTPFSGVAEMGLIAAGGVLLCCISVLTAFPALLELLPHPERILRTRHGGEARPFAGRLGHMLDARPRTLLFVSMVVIVVFGWFGLQVRYDPDLIALMPAGAESVIWERRLEQDDERTTWHAVVLVEPGEEARRVSKALREQPAIGSLAGGAVLYPGEVAREARLRIAHDIPPAPTAQASEITIRQLRSAFDRAASSLGVPTSGDAWTEDGLLSAQRRFAMEQSLLRERIETLRTSDWPTLADLPSPLRELTTTNDGDLIFRIYPPETNNGASVLSNERLGPFVRGVLAVASSATGPAVQIYESTRLIIRSYEKAAAYAIIAIFLVLLWDFRRLSDALCALIPVVLGGVLTLGAMRLLAIPLNFANTIVLPLLMGIGVDAGVHAVHRWRLQPHHAPAGLAGGTGRAVSLTVLTTILGFASLTIAEHRGVRSLGVVMTLGLALVWVSTIFVLPPILRLRTRISPPYSGAVEGK